MSGLCSVRFVKCRASSMLLIVVGTVFLLLRTHFLGEGEGLSHVLHPLLKDGTHDSC